GLEHARRRGWSRLCAPATLDKDARAKYRGPPSGGVAKIVDIGRKPDVRRRAVATGTILRRPTTVRAIRDGGIEKGDVLASAEVAALHAMKGVWQVLPHCHPIPITAATVAFDLRADRVIATTTVEATYKPGVEME